MPSNFKQNKVIILLYYFFLHASIYSLNNSLMRLEDPDTLLLGQI